MQALSLLNNAFVLRMADEFAKRVQQAEKTHEKQVHDAWKIALARAPDKEEARLAVKLVNEHGLSALCRALFNCNEFVIIE